MSGNSSLPLLAARLSKCIKIYDDLPQCKESAVFSREQAKTYRVMKFSHNGELFAYCDAISVYVVQVSTNKTLFEINEPKTADVQFSPLDNYLITWEPFAVKNNSDDNSNLSIWDMKTGSCTISFIQKKHSVPLIEWSDDESLAARKVNNEIHFHEKNDFSTTFKKLHMQKISDFSLSKGPSPYHVTCYVPGTKGQPSFVRLFKYPNFEGPGSAIANKSFFKADAVSFFWSPNGKSLLALTSIDVDKSGTSYYGEQALHYLDVSGESCRVQLAKDGPIYSLQWSPSSTEFTVVYGYMPAKATVFNLKCTAAFDFGTGPRNAVSYNAHGNILLLYGFGNLRGNVEVWDTKKYKMITKIIASDSTYLEWAPNGIQFCTATTAPRLHEGNGFKIWHYSGSLLHETKCTGAEKLYEMKWQNKVKGTFKVPVISYKAVEGVASSQPQASKLAYVPPSARDNIDLIPRIKEQYEQPSNMKLGAENLSKNAAKNKKKKDAKKAKKVLDTNGNATPTHQPTIAAKPVSEITESGDIETDKKIRNLKKKIDAIQKLKELKKSGKVLEVNQLEKMKKEEELTKELKKLTL